MAKRKPKLLPSERDAGLPVIVERYVAGESIQDIAQDNRVAARTLYRWMLGGLGDDAYHDLVTECLTSRIADADSDLRGATEQCQIARAREEARFARMDLERRRPALYGSKQEVRVQVSTDMAERLAEARERLRARVVEGEVIPNPNGSHGAGGTV